MSNITFLPLSSTIISTDTGSPVRFQLTNLSDKVLTLYWVDRSGNIALDIGGNGGTVYRLYQAAFDRAPDKAGLGYWMQAMDNGLKLAEVANGFTAAIEFQALYGASPTNEQLVKAMYHNVLHRSPDAGGLKFWLDALSNGSTTNDLLTSFSDSAENQAVAIEIIGQGFSHIPVQ